MFKKILGKKKRDSSSDSNSSYSSDDEHSKAKHVSKIESKIDRR